MYKLIKNKTELITKGTQIECLKKFHSVCGFSFENHKKYSFDSYNIIKSL
jgi:hypothetical protein